MKILICGLGSIGLRHLNNLVKLGYKDIIIFSSRKPGSNKIRNFEFFKVDYKPTIKSVSGKKIYGYLIKGYLAADIDNINDFRNAEKLFKTNKGFIK